MALLSNINDKFAVDSTGAIQFNGQVGTSGYVLKSNANAAPTWVDPSTVIGGPYLPLTGGTLTGATATASGISFTVGGTLTGTTATFTGDVIISRTGGNDAKLNLLTDGAGGSESLIYFSDSTDGAGRIRYDHNDGSPDEMSFYTASTKRFYINGTGNATFAGTIGSGAITSTGRVTGTQGYFGTGFIHESGGYATFGSDSSSEPIAISIDAVGSTAALKIETDNNATFAGAVGVGASPTTKLSVTDGTTMYADSNYLVQIKRNATNGNDDTSRASILLCNNSNGMQIAYGGTTDRLRFLDGGAVERFTMLNGGNIGIGTTSPGNKLTIASGTGGGSAPDSRTLLHIDKNGEAYISINSPAESFNGIRLNVAGTPKAFMELYDNTAQGKKLNIGTIDARDLVFDTLNQPRMTILSNGNVGIGATTPASKLHVQGAIGVTTGQKIGWIYNPGVDDNMYNYILTANNGGVPASPLEISGSRWTNGNTRGVIFTHQTGGEIMTIMTGGNVGIGTTSPNYKLEVRTTSNTRAIQAVNSTTSGTNWGFQGGAYGSGATKNIGLQVTAEGASTNYAAIFENGNVGIGTTSPNKALTVYGGNDNGIWIDSQGGQYTSLAFGHNGTEKANIAWDNTNGYTNISTYGNGHLALTTGGGIKAFLNYSGNFGIGTTSPSYKLEVNGGTALVGGGFYASSDQVVITTSTYTFRDGVYINNPNSTSAAVSSNSVMSIGASSGNSVNTSLITTGAVGIANTSPQTTLHTGPTTTITNVFTARFAASNFFASGGNSMFYVPNTAANIMMFGSNQLGTNQIEFYHKNPGTSQSYVGRISTSGSATSYVTSSDYRLKENVVPISDSISRLNQLKPSRFNFIEEPNKTVDGFIAHEVQDIVPEAIVGEKDGVDENGDIIPQGIDQAKLVPLLVAAIQELEARVKELENK